MKNIRTFSNLLHFFLNLRYPCWEWFFRWFVFIFVTLITYLPRWRHFAVFYWKAWKVNLTEMIFCCAVFARRMFANSFRQTMRRPRIQGSQESRRFSWASWAKQTWNIANETRLRAYSYLPFSCLVSEANFDFPLQILFFFI